MIIDYYFLHKTASFPFLSLIWIHQSSQKTVSIHVSDATVHHTAHNSDTVLECCSNVTYPSLHIKDEPDG